VGAVTYLNHTRPAALGLASATPRATAVASPSDPLSLVCRRPAGTDGLWVIQPGSVAGYRAHEQFAELTSPHEAVARTEEVQGWLLVADANGTLQIETGCVAVDVRTLRSVDELPGFNTSDRDRSARDFLEASSHPYVVYQPYPAALRLSANSSAVQRITLDGDLEISGTTRPARFVLDVRVGGGQVAAAGSAAVLVSDFGVEVPQEAGGFVRVDPHFTLEVSLVLMRSA
jgi:YceI-like protein